MILSLRSDNPEAEIGLYNGTKQLEYETWTAHRQLAETLHLKIRDLLQKQGKDWHDITGVIVYKGPGSFTGLRIGIAVANALAASLRVPLVGADGEEWLQAGLKRLADGESEPVVVPEYGSPVHITPPRK
jgi:tRNA threonylcarbamoyladenosine biosynthesis protein TsaB